MNNFFNYETKEEREETVKTLFELAKNARVKVEERWERNIDFYNLKAKEDEIKLTDAYIQIESQISPTIPEPIFKGMDCKNDSEKARQREYVVKAEMNRARLKKKNTENERNLRIIGDSFAKVYFDVSKTYDDVSRGAMCIDFVNADCIFPDPTAKSIEECEYLDFVYYLHRRKAERMFADDLKKNDMDVWDTPSESASNTETFSNSSDPLTEEYNIQVMEHWYRDDEGDIACSILLGGNEIRHIAKYWKNTGCQNKNYPFVHFFRIKSLASFWNKSEIEVIRQLCETANHLLDTALENADLMSNDVWVVEENSLPDGTEITNEPGKVILYKAGKGRPQRAGGVAPLMNTIPSIQFIQTEIQRTLRNFDSNQGRETERVTTASGLAQLRADADDQKKAKDYDRNQGWEELFRLIDWTALEFYDDDHLVFLGVPKKKQNTAGLANNLDENVGNIYFTFNSNNFRSKMNERIVGIQPNGAPSTTFDGYYYPDVDVEVNVSSGIEKSKSFTVEVLQAMMQTQITIDNYKVAIKLIEELDIPQKQEIIDLWTSMFESQALGPEVSEDDQIVSQLTPQQQQMIRQNPRLLELAKQRVEGGMIGGFNK